MKYPNETERLRSEVSHLQKFIRRSKKWMTEFQAVIKKQKEQMGLDMKFKKEVMALDPALYKIVVDKITKKGE